MFCTRNAQNWYVTVKENPLNHYFVTKTRLRHYRAAGAFTKPWRRQSDLSPGFVIGYIYINLYIIIYIYDAKPKDGGVWAQIKKYVSYDSPKILKTYPGGYELSKKYRFYPRRIFLNLWNNCLKIWTFSKFQNLGSKISKFQNFENLKNHVFGVFRWIWQENILTFFSVKLFFDRFFR